MRILGRELLAASHEQGVELLLVCRVSKYLLVPHTVAESGISLAV